MYTWKAASGWDVCHRLSFTSLTSSSTWRLYWQRMGASADATLRSWTQLWRPMPSPGTSGRAMGCDEPVVPVRIHCNSGKAPASDTTRSLNTAQTYSNNTAQTYSNNTAQTYSNNTAQTYSNNTAQTYSKATIC